MLDLAPLLVSALILGLLGGGHCLGMCGGLMGALTLAIPPEQRSRRFRLLLAYNLGRILSYAAAGVLIGLAGWAVAVWVLALFGMGGSIDRLEDDPSLRQALPAPGSRGGPVL